MRDFISLYLTEFKSHVISFTGLHKNNAVYKRICRGKALTQMPVCHMLRQSMAKMAWTFSQFVNKISAYEQAPCVIREVKNLTLLGSLCSPYLTFFSRSSRVCSKKVRNLPDYPGAANLPYIRTGHLFYFGHCHFRRKIFGVFAGAFLWSNWQSSTLNDAFAEVRHAWLMKFPIKFSVMCDWYPPLLFATLFQYRLQL